MQRLVTLTLLAVLLALAACAPKGIALPVGDVIADPGRYGEQIVELEGEVADAVGLLSLGVFTLSDSSGEISVLTGSGLPAVGARLKVRGEVLSGIIIGGTQYGTSLQEDSRDYLD
jgi:predicted small lipoprotein YifL